MKPQTINSQLSDLDIGDRASPPDRAQLPQARLVVKHPAYPDDFRQNDLLTFYAWDLPEGGLHAPTVLLACGLIACNEFNGYLTKDRGGQQVVSCDNDQILPAGQYYFQVPHPHSRSSTDTSTAFPGYPLPSSTGTTTTNRYKYPVYPSFAHWAFPHGNIPQAWHSSSTRLEDVTDEITPSDFTSAKAVSAMSSAVIARDRCCTLSGYRDVLQRAHLCPRSEVEWFQTNGMDQYNNQLELSGDIITDDMANAITLKTDMHQSFDQKHFVIVRKKGQWVAHFLRTTHDFGREFHNRPVGISPNVAIEFLLARFAWAMFPLVRSFLERGGERLVKVRQKTTAGVVELEKLISKEHVASLIGKEQGRGRSVSPKKRKPEPDTVPDDFVLIKRKRQNFQPPVLLNSSFSKGSPELSFGRSIACESLEPSTPVEDDRDRLSRIRRSALQAQRPSDPSIICCDYTAAEEANAAGLEGPAEFGGGHLCHRCLGAEVEDDLSLT